MPEKSFLLKAFGKPFEVLMAIVNEVLSQGGEDKDLLSVLSNLTIRADVAAILTGKAHAVPNDPIKTALNARSEGVRIQALQDISDQNALVRVVQQNPPFLPKLRLAALEKISEPNILLEIAKYSDFETSLAALGKLWRQEFILNVALHAQHNATCFAAADRLEEEYLENLVRETNNIQVLEYCIRVLDATADVSKPLTHIRDTALARVKQLKALQIAKEAAKREFREQGASQCVVVPDPAHAAAGEVLGHSEDAWIPGTMIGDVRYVVRIAEHGQEALKRTELVAALDAYKKAEQAP
jgi:hypothetical protein